MRHNTYSSSSWTLSPIHLGGGVLNLDLGHVRASYLTLSCYVVILVMNACAFDEHITLVIRFLCLHLHLGHLAMVNAHIDTPTAESTMQGQLVRSS